MPTPNIDYSTNDYVGIDHEHHEIHEGDHFYITNYATVGSGIGSSLWFGLITPNTNKWVHFTYTVQGTLVTTTKLFEGCTNISGGTILSGLNSNRNVSTIPTLQVRTNPSVSGTTYNSGTIISARSFGISTGAGAAKTEFGGESSRAYELILKSGTNYLVQITSNTDANLITYDGRWYELSNKSIGA